MLRDGVRSGPIAGTAAAELEVQLRLKRNLRAIGTESFARRVSRAARQHASPCRRPAADGASTKELTAENQALEFELADEARPRPLRSAEAQLDDEGDERHETGVPALNGKRILCVGGRSNLVQFYRALVERRGGEFLHHDGGLEEYLDTVTRALSTVDAVVCPIDCVSHAACLKVKRACKHLLQSSSSPLRSSGLSSPARCLQVLAV